MVEVSCSDSLIPGAPIHPLVQGPTHRIREQICLAKQAQVPELFLTAGEDWLLVEAGTE